ncbi:MAG: PrgI family protein, partial [Clostridiales bacterium]|nr:PrgI family protein [Clostridiales bacterium]
MKKEKNNVSLVKVQLSKKERKQIEARLNKLLKKEYSVQTTIPYLEMFKDGICQVTENYYTKTIRFSDIDYQLVDYDSAGKIFDDYCRILNYFDEKIKFQLTFENQTIDINTLLKEIDIPEQEDKFNEIRIEYADMLK